MQHTSCTRRNCSIRKNFVGYGRKWDKRNRSLVDYSYDLMMMYAGLLEDAQNCGQLDEDREIQSPQALIALNTCSDMILRPHITFSVSVE